MCGLSHDRAVSGRRPDPSSTRSRKRAKSAAVVWSDPAAFPLQVCRPATAGQTRRADRRGSARSANPKRSSTESIPKGRSTNRSTRLCIPIAGVCRTGAMPTCRSKPTFDQASGSATMRRRHSASIEDMNPFRSSRSREATRYPILRSTTHVEPERSSEAFAFFGAEIRCRIGVAQDGSGFDPSIAAICALSELSA